MSKKNDNEKKIKTKKTIRKRRLTARESDLLTASLTEAETQMTQGQCTIWRGSDVRARIRNAIAQWAKVSPSVIISSQRLKDLAHPDDGPWGIAQQLNLVAITNRQNPPIFRSTVPGDDNCQMDAPNNLISGDTTVIEWEAVVWTHQDPETFCKRSFG